jgi:hypothetical protein
MLLQDVLALAGARSPAMPMPTAFALTSTWYSPTASFTSCTSAGYTYGQAATPQPKYVNR